jgi:hypothetical protein
LSIYALILLLVILIFEGVKCDKNSKLHKKTFNPCTNFGFASHLICFLKFVELGTSEESGKDWSDLEAEAAAADKEDFNVSSRHILLIPRIQR